MATDLLLGCEDVVKVDLRDGGAHDVVDVRLDLAAGVGEGVVCFVDRPLLVQLRDLELDRHLDVREDVVLGLCLAANFDLLESHRDGCARDINARAHQSKARIRDALVLAASLDDLCGRGICAKQGRKESTWTKVGEHKSEGKPPVGRDGRWREGWAAPTRGRGTTTAEAGAPHLDRPGLDRRTAHHRAPFSQ